MIVVLAGAPGAGKGTQADLLVEKLGYRKLSTGDALRKHVNEGTEIGKKAKSIMESGNLVPDDVLFEVLRTELGTNTDEKILLDGYPRNVSQAKTLDTLADVHPVKGAIHLDVDREELIERLCGRRVCKQCGRSFHVSLNPPKTENVCDACNGELIQRADDNIEKVKVRLEVYEQETKPILDYYRDKQIYHQLAGGGHPDAVFGNLSSIVEGL